MLSAAAPAELRTEAFTWLSTAVSTGMAIGAALAGLAVDHVGVRATLLIATPAALAAALAGTLGRSELQVRSVGIGGKGLESLRRPA